MHANPNRGPCQRFFGFRRGFGYGIARVQGSNSQRSSGFSRAIVGKIAEQFANQTNRPPQHFHYSKPKQYLKQRYVERIPNFREPLGFGFLQNYVEDEVFCFGLLRRITEYRKCGVSLRAPHYRFPANTKRAALHHAAHAGNLPNPILKPHAIAWGRALRALLRGVGP